MKIDLVIRDGKYYIRKQWGIFTFWWNNDWTDSGWRLSRDAMEQEEAETIFTRIKEEYNAKNRFLKDTDKVVHTFIPL